MRTINGKLEFKSNKAEWIQLSPYQVIGETPKEFTPRDLFLNEVLKVDNGYIKIIDFGGAGFFGKDSFSWIWIKIKEIKRNLKNPNKFYIEIKTHNPNEAYGGVNFGGWTDSIEECITKHFPKEHTKENTGSLYYHKTLKITKIEKTDIETGEKSSIVINDSYNTLLNALS